MLNNDGQNFLISTSIWCCTEPVQSIPVQQHAITTTSFLHPNKIQCSITGIPIANKSDYGVTDKQEEKITKRLELAVLE